MRNKGKFAPHYHISPQQGLLNDPNGLSYFKGAYHVFYQYNPHATDHTTKYWGHLRSHNLQDWVQEPIALKSEDWFDKNGVYSGGAIVHEDTLYLFYTGNTKDENGVRTSYQCLATSTDGVHFEKHGPILEQAPGFTGHVRDPKVWYDGALEGWWMILGAQRQDKTGDTIAYFSKDLKNWDYKGSIYQLKKALGFMWECPDLVFLVDQVTGQEKAVFIFSPQGLEVSGDHFHNIFNTVYMVGTWDNQAGKFIPDREEITELDHGFEFYAPQSFVAPDGRVIMYAWVGTMWPEVEAAVPSRQDDWIHILSQPRQLVLRDGRLYQAPLEETQALASGQVPFVAGVDAVEMRLNGPSRITLGMDGKEDLQLTLDHHLRIHYQAKDQRLTISRKSWTNVEKEDRAQTLAHPLTHLDIWLDASSFEIFVNQGAMAFSGHLYADQPLSSLQLEGTLTEGAVHQLRGYQYQDSNKN